MFGFLTLDALVRVSSNLVLRNLKQLRVDVEGESAELLDVDTLA